PLALRRASAESCSRCRDRDRRVCRSSSGLLQAVDGKQLFVMTLANLAPADEPGMKAATGDPLSDGKGSGSRPLGNGSYLSAGSFFVDASNAPPADVPGRRRETSPCVAHTADVSGMCPHVQRTGNNKVPICRHFSEAL